MIKQFALSFAFLLIFTTPIFTQENNKVVEGIVEEAYENSQLEILGHELMDDIGPRLVGTPQMQQAHDWVAAKYKTWEITAENQKWGEWKGWERDITHIDMVYPRVQSLTGTQLAWSPGTSKKGVTAEVVVLPKVDNATEFQEWLPTVKGKLVMIAMKEATGRSDSNWEKYATPESFQKMKDQRADQSKAWKANMKNMGYNKRTIIEVLENAGAAGIVDSYWSKGFGVNKIFGARTKKIPTVDIELEDYTMLYRMVEHDDKPKIHVVAQSKDLGVIPTFNTIDTKYRIDSNLNSFNILIIH